MKHQAFLPRENTLKHMLIKEELPLEAEDIKKLKRNMVPVLIFPFAVIALFYFMGNYVLTDMGDSFAESGFQWIVILFGLIFMGIVGYMIWSQVTDLRRGVKERIEGLVTDKRLNIHTTQGSGSTRGGRKTKTTRDYYIYLEGVEYKMDYKFYNQIKTGERIVFERTPRSGFVFNLEKLTEQDEAIAQEEQRIETKYLNTQIGEVPLNQEDLKAMERAFKADMKRKVTWMIPFLFIIFSFITSGYWGLLVFLFPLVIVPVVQVVGLIRRWTQYSQSKTYGQKQGTTALVEDKLTITSNRSSNKSNVRTSWGTLSVSPRIYDELHTGDKIVIYKTKFSKRPLSIVTLDQQEYYLI